MTVMLCVNVGCGATPTPGWLNVDNSLTVRLAPWLAAVPNPRRAFARTCRASGVRWARATRLPVPAGGARALYSCHMMEHLSRPEASRFLEEAMRVLAPGGVIRLVLPDLRALARWYLERGDADAFMSESLLAETAHPLWTAIVGRRNHQWLYDAASCARALDRAGFADARETPFGTTRIPDPGALDLREREEGSFCVEATRP